MKSLRKLRPLTVDRLAEQSESIFGKVWQIMRMFLLDRALYWGAALAYAVPFLTGLLGGGAVFDGNPLHALALGSAFTVLALVSAVLIAVAASALGVKCPGKPTIRRVQKMTFVACAVGFLAATTHFVPQIFAVTTAVGYFVATTVLYLVAEWARGQKCSGKGCAVKQKNAG